MVKDINIKLDIFNGPIHLLYNLIEKNKIDIYDIPIAEITNQYIACIENFKAEHMDNMSEFIVMATTLLEIKSKMLLPKNKISEAEDEEDLKKNLQIRLLEYAKFRHVAEYLKDSHVINEEVLYRKKDIKQIEPDRKQLVENMLGDITINTIMNVFKELMLRKDYEKEKLQIKKVEIIKDLYTIEDKSMYIIKLFETRKLIKFKDLFNNNKDKLENIVIFLAVLELIKDEKIRINSELIIQKL